MTNLLVESKLRCPYCHDQLNGSLVGCGCGAIYHNTCIIDLAQCASCFSPESFSKKLPAKQLDKKNKSITNISHLTYDVMKDLIAEIKTLPIFKEAFEIAQHNCSGPIWLVGGKVYRFLTAKIHRLDIDFNNCDFDFLTTETNRKPSIPDSHKTQKIVSFATDSYGGSSSKVVLANPYEVEKGPAYFKFVRQNPKMSIDILNLHKIHGKKVGLLTYFNQVPLSVQSIAVDFDENLILGSAGLSSIFERRLLINNKVAAELTARKNQQSMFEYGKAKAMQLGFDFEFKSIYA